MQARRAIIEVHGGSRGFRRAVIEAGQSARVGRTSLADVVVPGDDHLAQLHWELRWDGDHCELADLGSDGGTFLGGQRVERAEVRSGAWVRAGGSDFSIFLEDISMAAPAPALAVLAPLAASGGLFAVLDAARSGRIVPVLQTATDEYACLYDGIQADVEADGAPYLVRFDRGSRLLPRLLARGHRDAWGIFIETGATFSELRAHLRRLLVVTRQRDSEPMSFRFYDPRVLRAFLPIATRRQVELGFGPVRRFLTEAADGEAILTFQRGEDGLVASGREGEGRAQDQ